MNDRAKTALILGMTSAVMVSPLVMSIFWGPIHLFQNLGFERGSIAPALAWILATITAIAYILYTMKVIPLVFAKQKEISLFNSGDSRGAGRRHCRRSLFSALDHGYAHGERRSPHPPGAHFRHCFWISPHQLDSCPGRLQVCHPSDPLDIRFRDSSGDHLSRGRA